MCITKRIDVIFRKDGCDELNNNKWLDISGGLYHLKITFKFVCSCSIIVTSEKNNTSALEMRISHENIFQFISSCQMH